MLGTAEPAANDRARQKIVETSLEQPQMLQRGNPALAGPGSSDAAAKTTQRDSKFETIGKFRGGSEREEEYFRVLARVRQLGGEKETTDPDLGSCRGR